jgi:UDP-hydrolysing UDP-N-acetyl-D-glucosamine 2-epimerase
MKTIGVVTVGRSDYGIYLPILQRIQQDPDLHLHLLVSGMHLEPRYGMTVQMIESDGYPIEDRIKMLNETDRPEDIAASIGQGVIGFSESYAHNRPDIIVVLGDRFEMYSAALAALPFNIPVAHIHGGELTKGAIDDALRHSMTKLSHLHFVSTEIYRRRVIQLGEEPWRVILSGAPGLDNLDSMTLLSREKLESQLEIDLSHQTLLVTFHPVTLEYSQAEVQIGEVLNAIERSKFPAVFTQPNADTGSGVITDKITSFVSIHQDSKLVNNLGPLRYFSLMKYVAAMVGNSSSGIVEAPEFKLPVVNIGLRQEGRVRGRNVIDVPCDSESILAGIRRAVSVGFKKSLERIKNPYKQDNASEIIVNKIKYVTIDKKLLIKTFHDCKPL